MPKKLIVAIFKTLAVIISDSAAIAVMVMLAKPPSGVFAAITNTAALSRHQFCHDQMLRESLHPNRCLTVGLDTGRRLYWMPRIRRDEIVAEIVPMLQESKQPRIEGVADERS